MVSGALRLCAFSTTSVWVLDNFSASIQLRANG